MAHFFYKTVDKRCREDMTEFLEEHTRYHLMNGWNNMRSFANNVKLSRLGLAREVKNRAFECLEDGYWYEEARKQLRCFEVNNPGYSLGFNGRSGGYLVIYPEGNRLEFSGDLDLESRYAWPLDRLQQVTELVQAFDRVCDEIREDLICYCQPRRALLRRVI